MTSRCTCTFSLAAASILVECEGFCGQGLGENEEETPLRILPLRSEEVANSAVAFWQLLWEEREMGRGEGWGEGWGVGERSLGRLGTYLCLLPSASGGRKSGALCKLPHPHLGHLR